MALLFFRKPFLHHYTDSTWEYPLLKGVYNRRRYLTSYGKEPKAEFGTIYIDRNGVPDEYEGNVIITDEMASLGDDQASAEYRFEIREAGYYDIAVQLCFPYWDKNAIIVPLMVNQRLSARTVYGGHTGEEFAG